MQLDFSPLAKAIHSLSDALQTYQKDTSNDFVRDACIQRFEYTYELSHKMLKRFLSLSEPSAETVEQMSFPEMIRTADERGLLLHGWDVWSTYRKARGTTSHTYDESKALEVLNIIPEFYKDAEFLLQKLQDRLSQS